MLKPVPPNNPDDNTPPREVVRTVKEPTGQSNPFYGCAILLIAVCTFGFIITWTLYSGWKQNAEIASFTVHDAPTLPALPADDAKKAALKAKVASFAAVASNGKPVTLTFTTEELNTLLVIAPEFDPQCAYNGIVYFTGLDPVNKLLKADIRWKMNNLPFVKAPDRFLAGHATFKPIIENNALEIHLENIEVPGKTVSPGFLRQLQNWPWLNLAKLKDEVRTPLGKVTRFDFSEDGTVFALHCGETVKP
jgi:hypothetical protein